MRNYTHKTLEELRASYAQAAERRRATCAARRATLEADRRAADAADPIAAECRRLAEVAADRRRRAERQAARKVAFAAKGLDGSGRPMRVLYLPAPANLCRVLLPDPNATGSQATQLRANAATDWRAVLRKAGSMAPDALALAMLEEPERVNVWRDSFPAPIRWIPAQHWRFFRWEEWETAWADPSILPIFRHANRSALVRPGRWAAPSTLPPSPATVAV